MRKEFEHRILLLTLLAIAFTTQTSAQSTMSIELSAAPGYRDNVFDSPDIYIRDNTNVVDTVERSQRTIRRVLRDATTRLSERLEPDN